MIGVIVEEKIKEGQLDAFLEHMSEMIALTKLEKGCIAYDLYESADGSGDIVMIELWEDQAMLDDHMASEHFKRLVPSAEAYMTEPPVIKIFNKL